MASKIKDTPVLTGKALERFNRDVKANEHKKLSEDERKRIQAAFKRFTFKTC